MIFAIPCNFHVHMCKNLYNICCADENVYHNILCYNKPSTGYSNKSFNYVYLLMACTIWIIIWRVECVSLV